MISENDKQTVLIQVNSFVQSVMSKNDIAHDFNHVQRVLDLAKEIAKEDETLDLFLIELLVLLHDINDHKLISNRKESFEFLIDVGFLEEEVVSILNMLEMVSFSQCPISDSTFLPELLVVRDADRLDAIGAIGIARAFAYSGANHLPFYGDNPQCTVRHFQDKLLGLHNTLHYERSKTIAKRRVSIIQEFYIEFCDEVGVGESINEPHI